MPKQVTFKDRTIRKARPRPVEAAVEHSTGLGRWMTATQIGAAQVAEDLGIARSYVYGLRSGDMKPGLELAVVIEIYTGGAVKPVDWIA